MLLRREIVNYNIIIITIIIIRREIANSNERRRMQSINSGEKIQIFANYFNKILFKVFTAEFAPPLDLIFHFKFI